MLQPLGAIPTGRRRLTLRQLQTESHPMRHRRRDNEVHPGHYIAALKQAAPKLGIPARLVAFMDQIYSLTKPQDWQEGYSPIVWPSNRWLQDQLELGRSAVKGYVRLAIEYGLILPKDSPNGTRFGYRNEDGHIVEAYGFDLSPIAARHQEFVAAAATWQEERRRRRRLRAELTTLRNRIFACCEFAMRELAEGEDWAAIAAQAATLWQQHREDDLGGLEEAVKRLRNMSFDVKILIDDYAKAKASLSVENDPYGTEKRPHNTTTNQPPASKEATSEQAQDRAASAKALGSAPEGARSRSPESASNALRGFEITPTEILTIAPRFRAYFRASDRVDWRNIVEAADFVRSDLGISPDAWRQACHGFNRQIAAIAVAVISARYDSGEVRSPGGLLRFMIGANTTGKLHLDRTLYGLFEKHKLGKPSDRSSVLRN